jgi:hypothetical protein
MGNFELWDRVRIIGTDKDAQEGIVVSFDSRDNTYQVRTNEISFPCWVKENELELVDTNLSDGEIFRIAAKVAEILVKKPEPKEPEKPQTKYKVGDEVVIRKDLDESNRYCMSDGKTEDSVGGKMLLYAGKKAKITSISKPYGKYSIDIDGGVWNWTDEMFAGLASEMLKMARLEIPMPDHCLTCKVPPMMCKGLIESKSGKSGNFDLMEGFPYHKRRDDCPLVEVE